MKGSEKPIKLKETISIFTLSIKIIAILVLYISKKPYPDEKHMFQSLIQIK